ncbi:hypothetical protein BKA82DRAFT_4014166 [Pisolithus tinctorius]|nr:hypothetical protein BKA82DRAFT_4014166 [Pisolithus tinctorius]
MLMVPQLPPNPTLLYLARQMCLSQVAQLDPHHEALATKASKLVPKGTSSTKCKASISSGVISEILTSQIKIKANGQLLKDPLPLLLAERKIFIQQLEDHGCYLQKMIKIDTSWSHDDVTTHLHSWFPKVFEHFDLHHEQANTTSHTQPDWQLLIPNNGKLKLSTAIHPNRIVLAHFKGHQKASIANSNLWFVTRNLVPLAVFNKWKVESDIVGTDIEVMSDKGSEVIELLSSVAELNISTVAETGNDFQHYHLY